MKILNDYNLIEIQSILEEMGEEKYRGKQIHSALSLGCSLSTISTISKELREKLLEIYVDEAVRILERRKSKLDETEKYLFLLSDNNIVEGVFMKNNYGNTMCLSTQVGCRMGCKFCASTLEGLIRNLTPGEMAMMVALVNKINGGNLKNRAVTNIVLMGSGEPLDNYDNVIKFLHLISSSDGLNISPRNISLSTCGLVPNIYKLAEEKLPVNLTISLHQPFDEGRKLLMPVANAYKIKDILKACDFYFSKTGRRYIFEYTLVKGQNDDDKCVNELISLLHGKPCHINVIRLNEVKEANLKGTDKKDAYKFVEKLTNGGLSATVRRSLGSDIDGACGQLRRKYMEEKKND